MNRFRAIASVAIPLLLVPFGAGAYSFLPGGFDPGERILSIELVSGGIAGVGIDVDTGADPNDPADDTLYFESSVSTIRTNKDGETLYPVPIGDVIASGSLDFVSFPVPPGYGGWVSADFSSALVDLTIVDFGGSGLLLEVDYSTTLGFSAHEAFEGLIVGSLSGDFDVVGGEPAFMTAFGPGGDLTGVLGGFVPGSDICDLTNSPLCEIPPPPQYATDLAAFTAGATSTITPIPEPGTLALFGVGLLGLVALRRQ